MARGTFTKIFPLLGAAALGLCPASAVAQQVRISNLDDVAFGTSTNFAIDNTNSQNVCLYSSATSGRYQMTARGSGAGNAFTLSSGSFTLPYEVQWADSANQSSGTAVSAGMTLTGQTASTIGSGCFFNLFPSASLIIILRGSAIGSARAGDYTGTLTLLIAPQ